MVENDQKMPVKITLNSYLVVEVRSTRCLLLINISLGITGGMGKKRETFTNMDPLDDGDLAYRSTSNYLRQMAQQGLLSPTEMMTAQNIPRTKSASEMTPRNTREKRP